MLVDHEIRAAMSTSTWSGSAGLVITDLAPDAIGPCSVDLHLSKHFFVFEDDMRDVIDPREDNSSDGIPVLVPDGESFLLGPRRFVLASTIENISLPGNICGTLEGKSSLARLGLLVHVTAGFFDVGFSGYPTLELFNLRQRPIRLYPGMPIAQMAFEETSFAHAPYGYRKGSKYQHQGQAPAPSMYHKNFEERSDG